jgi:hypothetical protein
LTTSKHNLKAKNNLEKQDIQMKYNEINLY